MHEIAGSGMSPVQDALKTVSLNPNMSDKLLLEAQAAMERSSDDISRVNNMQKRSRIDKFLQKQASTVEKPKAVARSQLRST